jgi:hypothetical protein
VEVGADRAWVEGRNPYKLAKPSAWWLKLLHDYDTELVVMPSVKDCGYRLCRRVQSHVRQGLGPLATLHGHPDTVQMATYGLIPITTLTTWAIQSDKILRDLMARDTLRWGAKNGSADYVVSDLEYREELAERKKAQKEAEDADAVHGEAFRSMQFRNGSAISLAKPSGRAVKARARGPKDFRAAFDIRNDKTVISPASSRVTPPSASGPAITLVSS